jgi:hypothetical protein
MIHILYIASNTEVFSIIHQYNHKDIGYKTISSKSLKKLTVILVPRQNVRQQNVRRPNVWRQTSVGKNIWRDKASRGKTSGGAERPGEQNVRRDKMSGDRTTGGTKHPRGKRIRPGRKKVSFDQWEKISSNVRK